MVNILKANKLKLVLTLILFAISVSLFIFSIGCSFGGQYIFGFNICKSIPVVVLYQILLAPGYFFMKYFNTEITGRFVVVIPSIITLINLYVIISITEGLVGIKKRLNTFSDVTPVLIIWLAIMISLIFIL